MEEKQWFIYLTDHHEGPFTVSEIKNLVENNQARETCHVWKEGLTDWTLMNEQPDFTLPNTSSGEGHDKPFFSMEKIKRPAKTTTEETLTFTEMHEPSIHVYDVNPHQSIFCLYSKRTYSGPFSMNALIRKLNDKKISIKDSIWKEGWAKFESIEDVAEVMEGVNPKVLNSEYKKKIKKSQGSEVMGLSGVNVPKYRFWKGKIFLSFILIFLPVFVYQSLANQWIANQMNLTRINTEFLMEAAPVIGAGIRDLSLNYINLDSPNIPDFIKTFLRPFPEITDISAQKNKEFLQIARSPYSQGAAFSVAPTESDLTNPAFYVASNLPNGTSLHFTLHAKPETLLNATSYDKKMTIETTEKITKTPKFTYESTRPLPRGEYTITITQATGPIAFNFKDTVFLGGLKNKEYETLLLEFQNKVRRTQQEEISELIQATDLLESHFRDELKKFDTIKNIKNKNQKLSLWKQHNSISGKMYQQLREKFKKPADLLTKEKVRADDYIALSNLVAQWDDLHAHFSDVIEKGAAENGVFKEDLRKKIFMAISSVKGKIKAGTP